MMSRGLFYPNHSVICDSVILIKLLGRQLALTLFGFILQTSSKRDYLEIFTTTGNFNSAVLR